MILAVIARFVLDDDESAHNIAYVAHYPKHIEALTTVGQDLADRNTPAATAILLKRARSLASENSDVRIHFTRVLI